MPRRGIDLSEEQWRIVKGHAATRGQTISAFFGDVLMEYGLGRAQARPGGELRDYSNATTNSSAVAAHMPVSTTIDQRFTSGLRPGEPVVGGLFGTSRPAPKPAAKKR